VIAWIDDLSVGWLMVVMFAGTALVTAGIYFAVMRLARGEHAAAIKGLSPGMLPPIGLIFGLIVGFLVAGLWDDVSDARTAVDDEASSLRAAVLVASAAFPGRPEDRIKALIAEHIREAAGREWPAMASRHATLTVIPGPLADALEYALRLKPHGEQEVTAQGELVTSVESALDARRRRVILSESTVNWVRWTAVVALAVLTLVAIACVHSDNRITTAIAMGVFAAAVAVTLVLIASQDRPFGGQFGVKPDPLLEVMPRGS
jgi:hypothetical protein